MLGFLFALWSQSAGNQTYAALTVEQFEKYVFVEMTNKVFFAKRGTFVGGKGSDKPIIELNDLDKEPGDAITIPLRKALTGTGIYGDQTLWASEEAMVFYYMRTYINQHRHGAGTGGRMSRRRVAFDSDQEAAQALGAWLADKRDAAIFEAFYRLHPAHVVASTATGGLALTQRYHPNWWVPGSTTMTGYGAGPANAAAVTGEEDNLLDQATDKMSAQILDKIAAVAEENNFLPVNVDGEPRYCLVIHPRQAYQLRQDSDWNQAQQQANVRGRSNPMFQGAIGEWNSLIVFKSNRVEAGTTNTSVRRALMIAGNALASALAGGPFTDAETWDYGNEHRYMAGLVYGYMRGDFQSDDVNATVFNQGSMVISTYSPAVAT